MIGVKVGYAYHIYRLEPLSGTFHGYLRAFTAVYKNGMTVSIEQAG